MKILNFNNTQVASSETARDINRGVVLNLIRRRQPISRADLARLSGLQRSTISLISEQLMQEKWVVTGALGRLPRGRRPTFLRLNDRRAILVADVRPNRSTIAIADISGRFLSQESVPTSNRPAKTVEKLAQCIKHQMQSHRELIFDGIGISVPGRVDPSTGRIIFAPNLKWPEFNLKAPLEQATGLPVEMENAANACVLAEAWFGYAEVVKDMVVVTVSEGIGTGLLVNGQLVRGVHGLAGELGHVPLDLDGPPCSCGARGCWEVFGSNRAALRYYSELASPSEHISFDHLMTSAESGDPHALRALDRMAHEIGRGMRTIVAGLAPEEIVVIGDFTQMWSRMGPIIQAEVVAATLVGMPPRVRPASDSHMARLRGTVALVLQKHFGASSHEVMNDEAHPTRMRTPA